MTESPKDAIARYLTNHYSKSFYMNPADTCLAEMALAALDEAGFDVVPRVGPRPARRRQLAIDALAGGMVVTDTGHRSFITEASAAQLVDAILDKLTEDRP